ncbi:hypothetical protein NE237_020415 [Protea cynaroides]|uniref:Uncharacterized protein n=1 Tax=Protea cynaroides TaxID=273540 RepID=A0A9Q0H9C9_9MAGN|nr:hypothetical protein NE237_020415 [Protea cynaroides]
MCWPQGINWLTIIFLGLHLQGTLHQFGVILLIRSVGPIHRWIVLITTLSYFRVLHLSLHDWSLRCMGYNVTSPCCCAKFITTIARFVGGASKLVGFFWPLTTDGAVFRFSWVSGCIWLSSSTGGGGGIELRLCLVTLHPAILCYDDGSAYNMVRTKFLGLMTQSASAPTRLKLGMLTMHLADLLGISHDGPLVYYAPREPQFLSLEMRAEIDRQLIRDDHWEMKAMNLHPEPQAYYKIIQHNLIPQSGHYERISQLT